jgi:hypothetical protein
MEVSWLTINKNYYSNPTDVKTFSVLEPSDLHLATDTELDTTIEGWLYQIRDLINTDRKRDYALNSTFDVDGNILTDAVPAGIHGIALQIACNMVALVQARKQSNIITIGDRITGVVKNAIISKDLQDQLSKYPRGLPSYFKKYLT